VEDQTERAKKQTHSEESTLMVGLTLLCCVHIECRKL